ncbi:hypothetical protein PsorP6_014674 [Peronosclerospora sorghi]|uniref:Uncharacterized protein n=1 Tax=Peronosclerospora sorghi TaxID=230839 RepID=A0ACC0VRW7_9STRA|nr:hypothetical protein PsorP6_014674 [Peronosclerospora sorghi]
MVNVGDHCDGSGSEQRVSDKTRVLVMKTLRGCQDTYFDAVERSEIVRDVHVDDWRGMEANSK